MRRWAGRIAATIGVVLLVLFWVLAGAAYITARPADPMLWPPRPDAGQVDVVLVSNGYHAGLALPRETLAEFASGRGYPALVAVTQRFAAFEWIEFGWGDREFYRSVPTIRDLPILLSLRALFWSDASALHVVGLAGDPAQIFVGADLVRIPLSRNGFDQMLQQLEATFVPPRGGALPDLGRGLYGPSLFYPANGTFGMFKVCNHWIADLLGAAGLPKAPVLATLPYGLIWHLRWRAGLTPQTSTGRT
jgi:uncharacterized protein (TIGR02117 family)